MIPALKLAVLGSPIDHSLSPVMFRAAFNATGIQGSYQAIEAHNYSDALAKIDDLEPGGLNITSPLKQELTALADRLIGPAKTLGAINTLLKQGESWIGYNTDVIGVAESLSEAGVELESRNAVVVGAGGAAAAATLALTEKRALVTILNRTIENAEILAQKFGVKALELNSAQMEGVISEAEILVSCVGTTEELEVCKYLQPELAVLDANYSCKTALVAAAERAGCKVIPGINWLIHQGAAAFCIFTGESSAPTEAMRSAALENYCGHQDC